MRYIRPLLLTASNPSIAHRQDTVTPNQNTIISGMAQDTPRHVRSTPVARVVCHIDREELYTDLEARIQYLQSFLDFSAADIAALTSGARYIQQLIPAIVNIVYRKLLMYDITARAFTTRSTSYSGPMEDEEHLSEDAPQVRHRKLFLRGYLMKLCSDPTSMEFWEYLNKVGMMHVGQGRQHPLHIEYIHIGVCLGYMQDIIFEALLSHPKLKMDKKIALIKAIGKVLWIQNDLFAKWYVRDGEEFLNQQEKIEVEQEGYLFGKKIINTTEEGQAAGAETSVEEAKCPFTGASPADKTEEPAN